MVILKLPKLIVCWTLDSISINSRFQTESGLTLTVGLDARDIIIEYEQYSPNMVLNEETGHGTARYSQNNNIWSQSTTAFMMYWYVIILLFNPFTVESARVTNNGCRRRLASIQQNIGMLFSSASSISSGSSNTLANIHRLMNQVECGPFSQFSFLSVVCNLLKFFIFYSAITQAVIEWRTSYCIKNK